MTVYLDSSAVVKLYVPERGHELVRLLGGVKLSSAVTRVEVASALWRKERLGELDAADAVTLLAAFDVDLGRRLTTVVVDQRVLDEATEVVARHALRAYDAVQLATAIVARRVLGRLDEFAAFDQTLRRAAATEQFTLVPERLHAR